jgi:hypothetical protein
MFPMRMCEARRCACRHAGHKGSRRCVRVGLCECAEVQPPVVPPGEDVSATVCCIIRSVFDGDVGSSSRTPAWKPDRKSAVLRGAGSLFLSCTRRHPVIERLPATLLSHFHTSHTARPLHGKTRARLGLKETADGVTSQSCASAAMFIPDISRNPRRLPCRRSCQVAV